MIAPSRRGIWNVHNPTIKPSSVFGMVHRYPSHSGMATRYRAGQAGSKGIVTP